MSIVKHVCQQGRLNKRKGSPLATSGSGFQVSEGALVLKALLRCCLKRKKQTCQDIQGLAKNLLSRF